MFYDTYTELYNILIIKSHRSTLPYLTFGADACC